MWIMIGDRSCHQGNFRSAIMAHYLRARRRLDRKSRCRLWLHGFRAQETVERRLHGRYPNSRTDRLEFIHSKKAGGACYVEFPRRSGPFPQGIPGIPFGSDFPVSKHLNDSTYATRLDIPESRSFLIESAQKYQIEICGVNKSCP